MEQQVTVVDVNGTPLGKTFPRRAKQLVLKGRAYWADGSFTQICLNQKEATHMDSELSNNGYKIADDGYRAEAPAYDDEVLLKIAQKRVKDKRAAIRNVLLHAAALVSVFWAGSGPDDLIFGMAFGAWLMAGVYIWARVMSLFVMPLLCRLTGIVRKPSNPVEKEYNKLKTLPPERLAAEYEKL